MIFYDALSQWWEPEAQAYLRDVLNFPLDRQLRCEKDTNRGTRYHEGLTGNSPEMCRVLDSYGFANLKFTLNFSAALTSIYKKSDPQRFNMGTPDEVALSLRRAWEVAPTSERICEDVKGFENALDRVIEAKGTIVPDLALRSGRRYMSLKGNKQLKRKRKDTIELPPVHPHCIRALHMIKSGQSGAELRRIADEAQAEAVRDPPRP